MIFEGGRDMDVDWDRLAASGAVSDTRRRRVRHAAEVVAAAAIMLTGLAIAWFALVAAT